MSSSEARRIHIEAWQTSGMTQAAGLLPGIWFEYQDVWNWVLNKTMSA